MCYFCSEQDSKSSVGRTGDPAESDSGCSGSLPDSGRGMSDESERWMASSSGQSINSTTVSMPLAPGPNTIVFSGSYSPVRAAQFSSAGGGITLIDGAYFRPSAQRGATSELRSCHNTILQPPPGDCRRTMPDKGPSVANYDTYV